MGLFVGDSEPSKIFVGDTPISKVFLGDTQVRPKPNYLCFTAESAGSTIKLARGGGTPAEVTLETSTDGKTRTTYTLADVITLANVGDKVYWRNTSETDTLFSVGTSSYYKFTMTGSIAGSGDVNYLLNKKSTTTVTTYIFYRLFSGCSSLTTPPELPATTIGSRCYYRMFESCTGLTKAPTLPATTLFSYCYAEMFYYCTSLEELPALPATTLANYCYRYMFYNCSKIKLSTSKTGAYQTAYRIPTSGTGSAGTESVSYMFDNTGGTFTGNPSINTTYYTSNTIV